MKKMICMAMALGVMFSMAGCGAASKEDKLPVTESVQTVSTVFYEETTPASTEAETVTEAPEAIQEGEATEASLRQKLAKNTKLEIVMFDCNDYNADGKLEAFALVGQNVSLKEKNHFECDLAEAWFVSEAECTKIEKLDEAWQVSMGVYVSDVYKLAKQSDCLGWAFAPGGNHRWYENFAVDKNGHYKKTVVTVDSVPQIEEKLEQTSMLFFGSSAFNPVQPHFFKFDEENCRFVEYGGMEITQEQFQKVKGADAALKHVQKNGGFVQSILYRANGVININYTTNKENPFDHHALTMRVSDGKIIVESGNGEEDIGGEYFASILDVMKEWEQEDTDLLRVTFPQSFPY